MFLSNHSHLFLNQVVILQLIRGIIEKLAFIRVVYDFIIKQFIRMTRIGYSQVTITDRFQQSTRNISNLFVACPRLSDGNFIWVARCAEIRRHYGSFGIFFDDIKWQRISPWVICYKLDSVLDTFFVKQCDFFGIHMIRAAKPIYLFFSWSIYRLLHNLVRQ